MVAVARRHGRDAEGTEGPAGAGLITARILQRTGGNERAVWGNTTLLRTFARLGGYLPLARNRCGFCATGCALIQQALK